ncbi:unnamed protein product [Rotaria sp. Silwood2]|nr:unnamed protein product [Rotaria sp. Silwood2]
MMIVEQSNGISSPVQPFTIYKHSVELQATVADLWWTVNDVEREIIFELHVNTTGWIALGISPVGGMRGADIGVGWVDQAGNVHFQDRYAFNRSRPIIDNTTTDWFHLQGREQNGWTSIQFKRLLDTCDSMDVPIKSGTNILIFAYGLVDPDLSQPDGDISYHHTRRGTRMIPLQSYGNPPSEDKFTGLDSFEFRLNNYRVPSDDTTYHCKVYKVPSHFSTKRHAIANGSFCLENIVFDAHPGDLICIIGPIGSGKSSLLQTLTGEIPFFDGQVRLHGSFCYVPQEPWIFSSTVKKNILFGKDYDPQLFRRVVDATALEAGEMIQTGTYDELLARSSSFSRLLEDIHQQEKEQIERPMNIPQRQSSRHLTLIENEHEDDLLIDSENFETTEKGSVKWDVYITYLQEGVGVLFGIFILIFIFGFHQATSIVYSWWLAKWSDDESQRHGHQSNCTKIINQKINMIRSMNDTEWNEYRNGRFYFYCG